MKRMVTKKDVVETVNQAIEEGEIEVGGGSNYVFYRVDVSNGSFIYITDNENISTNQDLVTDLINHGHTSAATA